MYLRFDTFDERTNAFFNSMLTDLNPKIYSMSLDSFVFQDKQFKLLGNTDVPNSHVQVFVNNVLNAETDATGDGSFSVFLTLVDDENDIRVSFL